MHISVIVPYRDRAEHLSRFIPHITTYLSHFQQAGLIDGFAVHAIEQLGSAPFNRGKLLNCGVAIAGQDTDFVCLHDVDYLPLLADYTAVDRPTRLIWHGLTLQEDYSSFFGAVVQFPVSQFRKINGYSNGYWGWGFEDVELRRRCELVGLPIGYRDGRFQPLPHVHNGQVSGASTDAALRNRTRCLAQLQRLHEVYPQDGLSSLQFDTRSQIELMPSAWLHQVDIGAPEVTATAPLPSRATAQP